MHDPMTQILHHELLGILWHVDPEKGGDDDSCNWSGGRNNLTDAEKDWLRKEGISEHEYWVRGVLQYDERSDGTLVQNAEGRRWRGSMQGASALELLHAIWLVIVWRMPEGGIKGAPALCGQPLAGWRLRRRMARDLPYLIDMVGHGADNLHHLVSQVWAYNDDGADAMGELFVAVARIMRGNQRPWWRHPRFHVHHWRLQIHVVQNFKRWAFTRCARCGGRFQWGQTGVGGWNSDGPGWWFGREHLEHFDCNRDETGRRA